MRNRCTWIFCEVKAQLRIIMQKLRQVQKNQKAMRKASTKTDKGFSGKFMKIHGNVSCPINRGWNLSAQHSMPLKSVARVESQKLLRSPRFGCLWNRCCSEESRQQPINHPDKNIRSSSKNHTVIYRVFAWIETMLGKAVVWCCTFFVCEIQFSLSDVREAPVLELEGSMQAMPFHGKPRWCIASSYHLSSWTSPSSPSSLTFAPKMWQELYVSMVVVIAHGGK